MPIVSNAWVSSDEISRRVDRLRMQYAGNPLVERIDYRIGVDWGDDPAVFINVKIRGNGFTTEDVQQLAENMRADLLRLVRTDEVGVHSYLSFVN